MRRLRGATVKKFLPKRLKRSGSSNNDTNASKICLVPRSFGYRHVAFVGLFLLLNHIFTGKEHFNRLLREIQRDHNVITMKDSNKNPTRESQLPQTPKCSNAQLDAIYSSFKTPLNQKDTIKRFHTPLMFHTRCPDESWARTHFEKIIRGNESSPFLGVNVGCNKGLDAIEMARLLSQDPRISVKDWNKAMGDAKAKPVCGVPKDQPLANSASSLGTVHCIEPVSSTVKDLKKALRELHYEDSIVVTQAAATNYTGTVRFPNSVDSGAEGSSLKDCEAGSSSEGCAEIPAYTLDDYLREHSVNSGGAASNSIHSGAASPIDMLLIDAEGFDHEVLQGASETLKRVRYLLFEVHLVGNWMSHSLVETVETILEDFTCYWAGKNRLWRITNCLNETIADLYEYKSWSNVACVHRREIELTAIMEYIFRRTVQV